MRVECHNVMETLGMSLAEGKAVLQGMQRSCR